MRAAVLLGVAMAVLELAASAQSFERSPSSAKDRQRVVTIAHKMEEKPLDNGQQSDREWALKWVIDVPDIHVDLCPEVLGDFTASEYKYRTLITVQLTLSSAAFLIQHPDKNEDQVAEFTAGVEGVLRAYKSILHSHPRERSPDLDDLMNKQKSGQLADFIKDAAETCSSESEPAEDMLRGY